jgi:uncharacterized protein
MPNTHKNDSINLAYTDKSNSSAPANGKTNGKAKKRTIQQIFVNLPVKDLNKSIEFFTKIGFDFNARFTDKNATCMILGKNMYVMLITEEFFKTFTIKEISDAHKKTEVLVSLQMKTREEVNEVLKKAIDAGGSTYLKPFQHGEWMYSQGFQDLDGHQWEILFMDEEKMPQNSKM